MNAENKKTKAFAALCGRIFRDTDPQYFPSAEHRGRTIRLCTDACLGAFLADPDVFCKVHRNSDKTAARMKAEIEHLIGIWRNYDSSPRNHSG
jgi:hypothetical protein